MDIIAQALSSFGLTPSEVKIYREIVKEQETNPYALSKATGIPRTTVYEILTNLAFKELIELKRSDGFAKQQIRIIAKDPSVLRTIIRNRRSDLARLDSEIVYILPLLKRQYTPSEPNADFQFFPGIEGAKMVYTQACLDDVDLPEYVFNYKIADDTFGREAVNAIADAENKRHRRYIPKEILPLNDWTKHCLTYQYNRDHRYIEVNEIRYIDQMGFNIKAKISIKDQRIWIVSIEEGERWGIIMKSSILSQTLISIFNILWIMAIPITDKVMKQWGEDDY